MAKVYDKLRVMVRRVTFRRWIAKGRGTWLQAYRNLGAAIKGRWAERLALVCLVCKGYLPAPRPARMLAQTDLLLSKGQVLVLVEVKARTAESRAHHALTPGQKARLRRQARALAGRYPQYTVRLDLLLVFPHPPFVRHIVNVALD